MFKNLHPTAVNATIHCLTGCAIGEILGLIIGAAASLSNLVTIILSTVLAFVFGYSLTFVPLLREGIAFKVALTTAFVADTISIVIMELTDNLTLLIIPHAMDATLVNPLFWWSMGVALLLAFLAALPINNYLIRHGKGHAAGHQHHH